MAPAKAKDGTPLATLACPNPECGNFNKFGAGNLSVAERMGKGKALRRLYCQTCGHRFSERRGSLLEYAKLPADTVVRIIKCLGHGCSVQATADICQVAAGTVRRLLRRAGKRAGDFHQLQLERLQQPPEAVELDERHGRGRRKQPHLKPPAGLLAALVEKIRDAAGKVIRVRARRLFGPLGQVRRRLRQLHIGQEVNTAHVERINGTMRNQQARLGRRTRSGSRLEQALAWWLWLWRELYHWTRLHASLRRRSEAMAMGLAKKLWTVRQYVDYPVHVSDRQRERWAEQRQELLTSALDDGKPKKPLPTS